jgi:hypothetical protein
MVYLTRSRARVTRLRAGWPENRSSIVARGSFPGAKRTQHEAEHSSSSSANTKNAWSYIHLHVVVCNWLGTGTNLLFYSFVVFLSFYIVTCWVTVDGVLDWQLRLLYTSITTESHTITTDSHNWVTTPAESLNWVSPLDSNSTSWRLFSNSQLMASLAITVLVTANSRLRLQLCRLAATQASQSQSHVTTDDQSVSKSWIRAPCGSREQASKQAVAYCWHSPEWLFLV